MKLSLVGNDEGLFALALLPFASVSTQSDTLGEHRLEGGLKIPFAFRVPGWDLSAMTEVDAVRNERDRGHHWILVNSLSLGRPLFGRFSGFGEFFSSVSEERGAGWIGTANFWITYQANKNLRLDAGVYIGVTSAAAVMRFPGSGAPKKGVSGGLKNQGVFAKAIEAPCLAFLSK